MTKPIDEQDARKAAAYFGAMGGKAGTGLKKHRGKEHYARLSKLGAEGRARKRAEQNKVSTGKAKKAD